MSQEIKAILSEVFAKENIGLTDVQRDKFALYYDILLEWNQKMNLTAIQDANDVAVKHFLDSALILSLVDDWNKKVIDIGTGAGFPGVPIKIMKPEAEVYLFDSLQKRINFLEHLCKELEIETKTIHGRAEDYGRDKVYREQFDIVCARAVAKMPVLLEYCLPFVKEGGIFIALKGPELESELEQCNKALKILGGKIERIEQLTMADGNYTRNIAVIKKIKPCDKKYPRKAGTPQKNPLI